MCRSTNHSLIAISEFNAVCLGLLNALINGCNVRLLLTILRAQILRNRPAVTLDAPVVAVWLRAAVVCFNQSIAKPSTSLPYRWTADLLFRDDSIILDRHKIPVLVSLSGIPRLALSLQHLFHAGHVFAAQPA